MRHSRFLFALLPLTFAILLTLAFFHQLAFTDLILARGDTYTYFYPYWDARDAALAAGRLPLWTDDLFMGVPLLSNTQLGTFYPPNWLTVPIKAPDSIRVSILLHVVWAFLGAYALARRSLGIGTLAALIAGATYGLGGYLTAHVEQINQLQGLSWMPWIFLLLHLSLKRPYRYVPLMGLAWALQILSGHTQTVFITGVGLGVYALVDAWSATRSRVQLRQLAVSVLIVGVAAAAAVVVALPQVIPTQELVSLSNRAGGFNPQQATAFSLHPAVVGRGLLPAYAGRPFTEYVAFIGVMGLGLAILGAFSVERGRWPWVVIALLGLLLALGRFNPAYMGLAALPGFNLFRVPARWLALYALGAAMLAGLGFHALHSKTWIRRPRAALLLVIAVPVGLAGWAFLADRAEPTGAGETLPTPDTVIAWGMALLLLLARLGTFNRTAVRSRSNLILVVMLGAELALASAPMPYNNLADPAAYNQPRFPISQLRTYAEADTVPGRVLSISGLRFDPGDRATLESRWDDLGLSERGRDYAFTATKMQEVLAPNLPLTWDVPSIDGFDGGVLPTLHYTAFSSLLLPEGTPRTLDGRLRERLALDTCRGACLPDDRWLDLTNTQYVLTDKVYDLVHEGVFFDTTFARTMEPERTLSFPNTRGFVADATWLLVETGADAPTVRFDSSDRERTAATQTGERVQVDALRLVRYQLPEARAPERVTLTGGEGVVRAVSMVDTRTQDFVQLTPTGWARVFSGDVKIYENLDVMPRAFLVHEAATFPDDWDGTEAALDHMARSGFDPRESVVLNTDDDPLPTERPQDTPAAGSVRITEHTPTRIEVQVDTQSAGYVVLSDAYYPGWQVTGAQTIYRANVALRSVPVEAGAHTITLTYSYPARVLPIWAAGLALLVGAWFIVVRLRGESKDGGT